MTRYDRAAALFPRNIARLLETAEYTAPVPVGRQPSAEYVQAMVNRDAREFWDSAVSRPLPTAPALSGSRYSGGYSAPARPDRRPRL